MPLWLVILSSQQPHLKFGWTRSWLRPGYGMWWNRLDVRVFLLLLAWNPNSILHCLAERMPFCLLASCETSGKSARRHRLEVGFNLIFKKIHRRPRLEVGFILPRAAFRLRCRTDLMGLKSRRTWTRPADERRWPWINSAFLHTITCRRKSPQDVEPHHRCWRTPSPEAELPRMTLILRSVELLERNCAESLYLARQLSVFNDQ